MKNVLVTGCCGYIGSHTCVELLNNGYNVIGLDNFSNSKPIVLDKIKEISQKSIEFYEGDMLDKNVLNKVFEENKIDFVIDFAAYKSVGESVSMPIEYYINNVSSVLNLLSVMKNHDVKSLIFSSSATVYGDAKIVPITESCQIGGTTNPYGTSKLYVEEILQDLYKSDTSWNICIFRYFNPVGAHFTGLIGEDPKGIPANLMPFIAKVASGELDCLNIFGDDYETFDGTGVRDFIHIVDLAKAHINGLKKLEKEKHGLYVYNLGTGTGYSVLELIKAFEKVNDVKINYKVVDRRPGDVAVCYADVTKAKEELGWQAEFNIDDMCRDAYNYILKNKE
ncbi:MAG: UDP-glucose 4-epimerase GalE [Bacilli bacterium]|nr:UDP-glucose 4-epimerase GalE [Bacilli bacterium]